MKDGRNKVGQNDRQILNNVIRTKKPAVIVATKCDEANEIGVRELERLVNR
jgi:hypothetical protein